MGLEARCKAAFGGKRGSGKAHLDKDVLTFRGESLAFDVRLADVKRLDAADGVLALTTARGTAQLTLGNEAEKWKRQIANPRSRIDKLGVKPGASVALVGAFDRALTVELDGRAPPRALGRDHAVIFFAVEKPTELARLSALRERLAPDGAIWVIRKKGKDATVGEKDVLGAARAHGLVDVKVVSFSDTHTAEKLVIPVAARKKS